VSALLRKDLRLLAPWAWALVPGHALFAATGIFSPEVFFWMNAALACAFTTVLLILEWRLDAERFVASLPVTRDDIVRARYLSALGAALVATPLYALYGHALSAIGRDRLLQLWGERTPGWESWEGCFAFFLVVSLLSLVFLPFHFRLGFGRGAASFVAVTALLLLSGGVVLLWLGGGGHGVSAHVRLPSEMVRLAVTGLSASWGPWPATALILTLLAGLGLLSLGLSLCFYGRRDI
jgi:hypothetical protein